MGSLLNFFNLLGVGTSGVGEPVNYTIWNSLSNFFANIIPWVGNVFGYFVYFVVRFILNIVDFLQFFAKKLVGIDYWMSGKPSLNTLGDSDIIFRFLQNDAVQRVFRYLLGIFAVLIIVFTIIAIVKSEYDYVTNQDTSKADNSKGSIFRRSLKAIAIVILFPVMLVMGILASNAILASLVNAFNINNNLTLGSQIFTASAYDANRYRLYADNGIRYAASNIVYVQAELKNGEGEDTGNYSVYGVPTYIKVVVPKDFSDSHPFTGLCFNYNGKNYLCYIEKDVLGTYYNHYVKYFTEYLHAEMVYPASLRVYNLYKGMRYAIDEVNLHSKDSSHPLIQAAYNTWDFNELLTRGTTFEKSVEKKLESQLVGEPNSKYTPFISDSAMSYPDAAIYQNSKTFGTLHDGGANWNSVKDGNNAVHPGGLVPIPDEYYVMADIIDFMMSDSATMSIVSTNNPLINWNYGDGGYLDGRFVQGITTNNSLDKFVVDYRDSGKRVYIPYKGTNAVREDEGVIYIMAYYDAPTNRYIPVVNGQTYVDGYGYKHTFTSNYLSSTYKGLIVARGLLCSTYSAPYGIPTQLTTAYSEDASGNMVSITTPYYSQISTLDGMASSWAEKIYDSDFSLATNYDGLDGKTGQLYYKNAGGFDGLLKNTNGDYELDPSKINATMQQRLASSLPVSMNIPYSTGDNSINVNELNNIQWKYLHTVTANSSFEDSTANHNSYYLFKADQKINVRISNDGFLKDSSAIASDRVRSVPLYCFIKMNKNELPGVYNSMPGVTADVLFVYSEYENSDAIGDWFNRSSLNIYGDSIFGSWLAAGVGQQPNDCIGRILSVSMPGGINLPNNITYGYMREGDSNYLKIPTTPCAYISSSSISYNGKTSSLDGEGSVFNYDNYSISSNVVDQHNSLTLYGDAGFSTTSSTYNYEYGYFKYNILRFLPEIDGRVINASGKVTGTAIRDNSDYKNNDVSISAYSSNYSFKELAGTRVELANGDVEYKFGLYDSNDSLYTFDIDGYPHSVVVSVTYHDSTKTLTIMPYDYYILKTTDITNTDGWKTSVDYSDTFILSTVLDQNKVVTRAARLVVTPYDMQYVSSNGNYITYKYMFNSQYFFFIVRESTNGPKIDTFGKEPGKTAPDDSNYKTDLYKLSIDVYNPFVFKWTQDQNGKIYQYDPQGKELASETTAVINKTFYTRTSNFDYEQELTSTDGHRRFKITIYNDGERLKDTIVAEAYFQEDDSYSFNASDGLINEIQRAYQCTLDGKTYQQIPSYDGGNSDDIIQNFYDYHPTIQFIRESIPMGNFKMDFSINVFGIFGSQADWRLKIGFFSGTGDRVEVPMDMVFENGEFYLNYNFKSVPHMEINAFYAPGHLNILVLVFASILVFMVLGQAIWGMIARIYDIVLYFIILPGVVSPMPLGNDNMYNSWKKGLTSKVLGAYGVMIGLNFFFILVPAIKTASQLFTPADLNNAAFAGSWLSFLSADAINSLLYIMFLLVAFTLIKTLPSTISGIMGVGDADVYSQGKNVKEAVKNTAKEVGNVVSGNAAMDTVKGSMKQLKNFVPGSAVYDAFKEKFGGKGGKGKKSEEAKANAVEEARQGADDMLNRSRELSNDSSGGADITSTAGTIDIETNQNDANQEGNQNAGNVDININTQNTSQQQADEYARAHIQDLQDGAQDLGDGVVDGVVRPDIANNHTSAEVQEQMASDAVREGLEETIEGITDGAQDMGDDVADQSEIELTKSEIAKTLAGNDEVTEDISKAADKLANNSRYKELQDIIKDNSKEGISAESSIKSYKEDAEKASKKKENIDNYLEIMESQRDYKEKKIKEKYGNDKSLDEINKELDNYQEYGAATPEDEEYYRKLSDQAYEMIKNNDEFKENAEPLELQKKALEEEIKEKTEKANTLRNAMSESEKITNDVKNEVKKEKIAASGAGTSRTVGTTAVQGAPVGGPEQAQNAQHAGSADRLTNYDQIMNSINKLTEKAANEAEAARLAAEAARTFADIAGDRIQPKEKEKLTRDQEKLKKLQEKRDERDAEQKAGDASFYLKSYHNRKKAYQNFNEGKALEDQIFRTDSEAYKEEVSKRYNKAHNRDENHKLGEEEFEEAQNTYGEQIKNEQMLKLWNKNHKDKMVTMDEMLNSNVLNGRIKKEFDDEQYKRKAEARNDFINTKLDKKIEKQESKMQLKEMGLYESLGKRAALFLPRRLRRQVSDKERNKLQAKRDELVKDLNDPTITADIQDKFKKKIANIDRKLSSEYLGLLPGIARKTADGGRFIKSKVYDKWAEHKENSFEKAEKAAKQNLKTGKLTDGKFTQTQKAELNKLKQSMKADEVAKNSAEREIEKLNKQINKIKNAKMDDPSQAVAAGQLIATLNKNKAEFEHKRDASAEAIAYKQRAYNKAVKNFNKTNRNSYLGSDILKRKKLAMLNAERKQIVNEMNNKKRNGTLTAEQEQKYVDSLVGIKYATDDLGKVAPRFKKLAAAKNAVANAAYKGKEWTTKTAAPAVKDFAQRFAAGAVHYGRYIPGIHAASVVYRHHSRVKAARKNLASDEQIAKRNAQETASAQRTRQRVQQRVDVHKEAVANRNAAQARVNETELINAARKAISRSGNSQLINNMSKITDTASAKAALKTAMESLAKEKAKLVADLAAKKITQDTTAIRKQRNSINAALRQMSKIDGQLNVSGNVKLGSNTKVSGSVSNILNSGAVKSALRDKYVQDVNKLAAKWKRDSIATKVREAKKLSSEYEQHLKNEMKKIADDYAKKVDASRKAADYKQDQEYKRLRLELQHLQSVNRKYKSRIDKIERNAKNAANQEAIKKLQQKIDANKK